MARPWLSAGRHQLALAAGVAVVLIQLCSAAALLRSWARASAAARAGGAPPRKPAHCRTDLPGCVPRRIDFLYLLHVPKAAGSSVHAFLAADPARHGRRGGFAPRVCPMVEAGFEDYHCYGLRAWHRNATHMARACGAQRHAMHSPAARDWFGALGCNVVAGHYDMAMYAALDEAVRARTLVVATLREPRALAMSLFHYLPRAPRVLGPVAEPILLSIGEFVRGEAGLGIDLEAGATKMLAGDYCCFHEAPVHTRAQDRLRAAAEALDAQVGAVVVQERMQESLEYLALLLGWLPPPPAAFNENANPHPGEVPPGLRPRLDALLELDASVYRRALKQLALQTEVLRRRRGGVLAATRRWARRAGAWWPASLP